MSWVKLDDSFHRNDKQLQMSDGAFRLYVCAMSWCAQVPEPTGHLTFAQAKALAAALGKRQGVIDELVSLNAWEAVEDGYLIHDYDEYLEKGSRDRVRAFRARKRVGNVTGNGAVTQSNASHARAPDGYPVPEPVEDPPPVDPLPSVAPQPAPPGGLAVLNGRYGGEYDEFVRELNRATGRHFRGDAVSRKLYAARRRDGRSDEEMLAAARGVALSRHHMGLNDSAMPYNGPTNVLRSKVFDQLIALGSGEIGMLRAETADEQRHRELAEWAARADAEREQGGRHT